MRLVSEEETGKTNKRGFHHSSHELKALPIQGGGEGLSVTGVAMLLPGSIFLSACYGDSTRARSCTKTYFSILQAAIMQV